MTWRTGAAVLLSALTTIAQAKVSGHDHGFDAWSLLVDRFALVECSPGDTFDRIAREQARHSESLKRVLHRAEPWIAFIAAEIIDRDLPGELALLPMVESGYDAFAYSRRQAAGSWQLLENTALSYDLVVNAQFDGRRDMLLATPVALEYLEALHQRLDQRWDLAIQAYNAGPTRISRLLAAHNKSHPVDQIPFLPVPGETRVHFHRLMGLACLFSRAADFGFEWPLVPTEPAIRVIDLEHPADLARVTAEAGIDPSAMIKLNAGLRSLTTPAEGPHRLVVPRESAVRVRAIIDQHDSTHPPSSTGSGLPLDQARQILDQLQDQWLPERHYRHRVGPGENLWVLSQRYSVPVDSIRRSNGLDAAGRIRPGQLIRIPPGTPTLLPHQYRIQSGDTLWSIARDHRMSVRELIDINAMTTDEPLLPGQVITVRGNACCEQLFQILSP